MFLLRSISAISISLNSNQILSNMNVTQLYPRFSCFCIFFSFEINLRRRECFYMVTCINPAVVWVSLFHCYVQTSCWRTDCICELDDAIVKDRFADLFFQYSRYQSSKIFCTTKPNNCKNLMFDSEFLSTGRSNVFDRCRLSGKKYVCSWKLKIMQNQLGLLQQIYPDKTLDVVLSFIENSHSSICDVVQ